MGVGIGFWVSLWSWFEIQSFDWVGIRFRVFGFEVQGSVSTSRNSGDAYNNIISARDCASLPVTACNLGLPLRGLIRC